MLTALMPGLRQLRVPLAAGVVWIVIAWLLWARNLAPPGRATGLLEQTYALMSFLGATVALGLLGFAAYLIGEVWIQVWFALDKAAHRVRRLMRIPSLWPSPDSWLVDSIASDNGMYRELLPTLGVRRPQAGELTDHVREGLLDAMYRDINRANLRLLGKDAELHQEFERHWSEYLLKEAIAFPISTLVVTAAVSASPNWSVLMVSVAAAVGMWLALVRIKWARNHAAWRTVVEAIYLGRFPAPLLASFGLASFGAIEDSESECKPAKNHCINS
jgi:hypothetical protein